MNIFRMHASVACLGKKNILVTGQQTKTNDAGLDDGGRI